VRVYAYMLTQNLLLLFILQVVTPERDNPPSPRGKVGLPLNPAAGGEEIENTECATAEATDTPTAVLTGHARLGQVYLTLGTSSTSSSMRWQSVQHSIKLFKKEIQRAHQAQDQRRQALAYKLLGQAYNAVDELERSAEMYESSLGLYIEIQDPAAQASAINDLGSAYKALGYSQLAQSLFDQQERNAREDAGPPVSKGQSELGAWMTAVLEHRICAKSRAYSDSNSVDSDSVPQLRKSRSEYRVWRKDSLHRER